MQRDVLKPLMIVLAGLVAAALALGSASVLADLAALHGGLEAGSPLVSALLVLNIASGPFALAAIFGLVYLYGHSRLGDAFRRLARSHARTLRRLKASRDDLQLRVAERSKEAFELGKRLDIALRDSPVTVALQDTDLNYTWVRNAPDGMSATNLIGSTDAATLQPEQLKRVMKLKRQVLETGEDARFEVHIPGGAGGTSRYFDIIAEPYRNADGELEGLLSVGVETTDARRREEQIKDALMEISHRTKNQLSVLMALTRGLSARVPDKDAFIAEFSSRLHAMLISQDVLVDHRWQPARFDELLRAQLAPYLNRPANTQDAPLVDGAIHGPNVSILPMAVQNVGLVLHEIIRSALGHGASAAIAAQMSWSVACVDEDGRVVAGPIDGASQTAESEKPKTDLRIRCRGMPPELAEENNRNDFALATAHRLSKYALEGSFSISTDDDGSASAELLMPLKFAECTDSD